MGSALGPVLANIIMTELEKTIIPKLFADGIIKFYSRYVDDTLVLVKKENINFVLDKLNSFNNKHLRFTVDTFEDNKVHFLDLLIDRYTTDLYFKETHTGQYTAFDSFTPWRFRTAWVRSLFSREDL